MRKQCVAIRENYALQPLPRYPKRWTAPPQKSLPGASYPIIAKRRWVVCDAHAEDMRATETGGPLSCFCPASWVLSSLGPGRGRDTACVHAATLGVIRVRTGVDLRVASLPVPCIPSYHFQGGGDPSQDLRERHAKAVIRERLRQWSTLSTGRERYAASKLLVAHADGIVRYFRNSGPRADRSNEPSCGHCARTRRRAKLTSDVMPHPAAG